MEYSKIDELERLEAQATPGPWRVKCANEICAGEKKVHLARVMLSYKEWEANANYIVAACNAVPELIAEHSALRERVRELEAQRAYLAKLLGDLCTTQKDGQCPLFYACPASGFGWSCGNAIKEDWVYAAEQAAKEEHYDG